MHIERAGPGDRPDLPMFPALRGNGKPPDRFCCKVCSWLNFDLMLELLCCALEEISNEGCFSLHVVPIEPPPVNCRPFNALPWTTAATSHQSGAD